MPKPATFAEHQLWLMRTAFEHGQKQLAGWYDDKPDEFRIAWSYLQAGAWLLGTVPMP